MHLRCLCDWNNHEHPEDGCPHRALMYQWYDGKNYQLCPLCIDAIEAWRIVRDAPYGAKLYLGVGGSWVPYNG